MLTPLPVRYHQQDTPTYCGPATAMMILDAIGSAGPQQNDLNARLDNIDSSDAATPESLRDAMNYFAQGSFKNTFDQLPGTTADAVSIAIAAQVIAGSPVAAVVFAKGHWLVVTDVNLGPPNASGERQLLGLYVNSPSVTPLKPPCQHDPADPCASTRDYGSLEENQYVSYEAWAAQFFTGYGDGYGHHLYVALSGAIAEAQAISPPAPAPLPELPRQSNDLIYDCDARTLAQGAVQLHNLSGGPLGSAFTGVIAGTPVFVRMLYGRAGNYYLVPMVRDTTPPNDTPVGVVRIDAHFGTFLGAAATKDGNVETFEWLQARASLLSDGESISRIRAWQPSRESRSPFAPFYQIIKSDGSVAAFLTVDHTPQRFDHPTLLSRHDVSPRPPGK